MKSISRTPLTVLLVFCLSLVNQSVQAAVDFSGIWTRYSAPGQGRGGPVDLPFTAEGQSKVDAYRALIGDSGISPGGWCLGTGMPGSMLGSGGYPMEFIQRPEQITIVYEAHAEIRRIYLGDERVAEEDLFPDRNGYSVGRWEGDRLLVETTHLKEMVEQTYAHSDQALILEEYRLTEAEDGTIVLIAEMTMTDPVFYTQAVTATKMWALVPNARLLPYECNEPSWEEYLDSLREAAAAL